LAQAILVQGRHFVQGCWEQGFPSVCVVHGTVPPIPVSLL